MTQKKPVQRLMLALITLCLSGCATLFGGYGPKGQTRDEFEHYVESVFRLQNSMSSEVMMLAESDEALSQAEHDMQDICAPLNEYASRDSEGLSIGLFLGHQVEKSAIDCEKAANKVKSLLAKHKN